MEKMKAVVCYSPEKYVVEEVVKPKAGPGEIVIKVETCGVCGSDLKVSHGSAMFWGGEKPWLQAPVIPGHEFYGIVSELGAGSAEKYDLKIGDRVTTDQIVPCGKCMFCQTGKYWMCEVHNIYGFQKDVAEGAMAEYMRFDANSKIYKIPDSLTMEEASLLEPMACAIHTVQRAGIEFEDVVVMAGSGTLGLCMIQAIKLKTPKLLIVLDLDEKRLETAKKFGADICLNPSEVDVVKKVKELTNGYGCDVYLEATGSPKGVKQGLEMIRKLGRFVEFSVFGEETTTDWSVIGDRKELDIRGAHLGPYTYPIAINLFERKLITAEGMISGVYELENFKEAFEAASNPKNIKILVKP